VAQHCYLFLDVTIVVAQVIVGSLNDWQKERQFKALNERKEERGVKVIRDGVEKVIDVKVRLLLFCFTVSKTQLCLQEVLVGDIALIEPGEIIPCDGVFISGHNVKCDESGATGESDAIKKLSYSELLKSSDGHAHTDCFMISGSKVTEGVGKYVIVAVGTKSFNGRIMMGTFSPKNVCSKQLTTPFSQHSALIPKTPHSKSSSTILRNSLLKSV